MVSVWFLHKPVNLFTIKLIDGFIYDRYIDRTMIEGCLTLFN